MTTIKWKTRGLRLPGYTRSPAVPPGGTDEPLFAIGGGLYPYIFGSLSGVDPSDWLVLALLGGFAVVIGMMLAGAYKIAPPATVATFEYSYLVFVAAWDILIFELAPTMLSVIGMAMIVGAGMLVMQRRG